MTQGNAPGNTNWTNVTLPSFYIPFGLMFVVSNKSFTSDEFCTGCNYTIAIEVEKDSIVMIDGNSSDKIQTI